MDGTLKICFLAANPKDKKIFWNLTYLQKHGLSKIHLLKYGEYDSEIYLDGTMYTRLFKHILILQFKYNNTRDVYLYIYSVSAYMG